MVNKMVYGLVVALALVAGVSQAKGINEKVANDEISYMSDNDPAMKKAFAKAQKTLPDFLRQAAKPQPDTSTYALKVGLREGKNTEYFWVGDFQEKGDQFTAILDNTPQMVRNYRKGQQISFKRAQIVDWMYIDEGKQRMMGNFTACALLTKESAEEAAAFKKQWGLRCED